MLAGLLLAACSDGSDEGRSAPQTSTTSDAPAPTSSTTAVPTFAGDPGSPFCEQLRTVDPTALLTGDPSDPTSVQTAFGRLVTVLGALEAVAPPEVRPDAQLVAGGIAALDEALAAVGYDFDALAASAAREEVTAAVNDPAFAEAGNRLGAYRTQVCGL